MRGVSLYLPPRLRRRSSLDNVTPQGPAKSAEYVPAMPAHQNGPALPDSGIGIELDTTADGRLVVEHVWPGSPASFLDIQQGDVLLLIDGMQGSVSSIDVARDLILGPEGTTVTLQVLRGTSQLELGPIPRFAWLTMQQMDEQLRKLQNNRQDSQHQKNTEMYSTMMNLMQKMEAERRQLQETVLRTRRSERDARSGQRQLELALIEVTEASKAAWQEADKRERENDEKLKEVLRALAHVCAEIDAAQKRVQRLEGDFINAQQKAGNSDVQVHNFEVRAAEMLMAFEESVQTNRWKFNWKSSSSSRKTPSIGMASEETGPGGEQNKENIGQLRAIFGEQAYRLRHALSGHQDFSSKVREQVESVRLNSQELLAKLEEQNGIVTATPGKGTKMMKGKTKRKKSHESSLSPACNVMDVVDGWKEARPNNSTVQFWYNERTRTVAFSPPREHDLIPSMARQPEEMYWETARSNRTENGAANDPNIVTECDVLTTQTDASQSVAGGQTMLRDKMRNDFIVCNGEHIAARRASFGRHISVSGQACIADPFLADAELKNRDQIRGRIAIIGRGVSQFTDKAQIAVEAGAIGVVFVNTKRRLFDAIGTADGIAVPVLAVSISARDKLKNGADLTLHLDSASRIGSAAELERKTLAARMRINGTNANQNALPANAAAHMPPLVGGADSSVTGDAAPLGTGETPGRASVYSQDVTARQNVTDDHALVDPSAVVVAAGHVRASAHVNHSTWHHNENFYTTPPHPSVGLSVRPKPQQYSMAQEHRSKGKNGVGALHSKVYGQKDLPQPPQMQITKRSVPSRVEQSNQVVSAPLVSDEEVASKAGTKVKNDKASSTLSATTGQLGDGTKQSQKKTYSKLKVSLYRKAHEKVGVVPLPPGWKMRISRTRGEVLYYCTATGERRWSAPPMPQQGAVLLSDAVSLPSRTVSPVLKGQALQSPASHMMSPSSHMLQAKSTYTSDQAGDDSMSQFGAASQANPMSPDIQSIRTITVANDDMSEISVIKTRESDSGMVIPPWPDDLVNSESMSTMARILVRGKQIVCTRAEFGLQTDPAFPTSVVRGKVVRSQPWLADRDIENAADFQGSIALIGRGGCPFTEKAMRAQLAGAIAVVIVNFTDQSCTVLGKMPDFKLPVVSISKRDAEMLLDGTVIAVQWGTGMGAPNDHAATTTEADAKPWSFKITSQVGFDVGADAHLPVRG